MSFAKRLRSLAGLSFFIQPEAAPRLSVHQQFLCLFGFVRLLQIKAFCLFVFGRGDILVGVQFVARLVCSVMNREINFRLLGLPPTNRYNASPLIRSHTQVMRWNLCLPQLDETIYFNTAI